MFREISQTAKSEGDQLDKVFSSIAKKAAGIFTVVKLKDFIQNVATVRGEFQQLEIAFSTMLGNEEKASALMAQLTKTAMITPFGMSDIAQASKQLLAYGVEAEKVNETLVRLGDIAAGLSIPIGDLSYLYGTTMVQGRLFTQDLRQFTGRGIPLTKELAKQFGVAESEVGALVTAGKVGFPEVEKAIVSLTSAGGKFGGLMEAQSKTITGQISNLEDSIEQMFNTIGKSSEGVISDSLGLASKLVDHWEEIGKTILVVASAYGTYKAAVLAVAAAHKIQSIWGEVSAYLSLAKQIKSAKDAMLLFNMATKANPIGLILSAVSAAATAFFLFRKNSDQANTSMEEGVKAIQSETAELEALVSAAKSETASKAERKAAIDKINSKYGDYLDNLITEKDSVDQLTASYNDLKNAIAGKYLQQVKESKVGGKQTAYDNYAASLQNRLNAITEKAGISEKQQGRMMQEMQSWLDNYAKYNSPTEVYNALSDIFSKYAKNQLTGREQGKLLSDIQNYKKAEAELNNANQQFQAFSLGYSEMIKQVKNAGDGKNTVFSTLANEIKEASDKLSILKQQEKDLRAGIVPSGANDGFSFAKALEENAKAQAEAQKTLDSLRGTSSKQALKDAQKAQSEELKAAEETASLKYDLDRKRIENQISSLQGEKDAEIKNAETVHSLRMRLIDIEERYKLAEIDAEMAKEKSAKNKAALEQQKLLVSESANLDRAAETEEYTRQYNRNLEDRLSSYRTFEERQSEILNEYASLRLAAEKEGNAERIRLISEAQEKALQSLNGEILMEGDVWKKLFSDLGYMTSSELEKLIATIEKELPNLNLDPVNFESISDKLREAKKQLSENNPFKALKIFWDDFKKSADKTTKLKALEGIVDSFNSIRNSVSESGQALAGMFDSFGSDSLSSGLSTAIDLLDNMGSAANGVAMILSGNILGGITAIIKGLTSIVTIFNKIHDNKLQDSIEEDAKLIENLQDSYDKLSASIQGTFGSSAARLIEQQNANLLEQNRIIREQIQLEEDKKKTDEDAVEQYNRQYEDNLQKIEENKQAAIDAIIGDDIQSAISDFASALTNAWTDGTTAAQSAKDQIKKMLQQTVQEALKDYIQTSQQMVRIRQSVIDAMADDMVTDEEIAYLENLAEQLSDELEKKYGWAEKLFAQVEEDTTTTERTASTKSSLGASQESIDESNGRLTAIQGIVYDIRDEQKTQSDLMREARIQSASILEEIMGIHSDTSDIRSAAAEMKSFLKDIKSGVSSINDRGVKML